MSCYHYFDGIHDKFYAEVNNNDGEFFGILYRCSECSTIYFEMHCHRCELRIDECGCPYEEAVE